MDTLRLISLVTQRKQVWTDRHLFADSDLRTLLNELQSNRKVTGFSGNDIYPIRAISLVEVFTRSWIRTMVNNSSVFAERAISLIQNTKPDYHLVLSITGKVVTFGDIVAHTVSVSSLGHIFNIFETLCSKHLRPLLESASDRWEIEINNKPVVPIIDNYDDVCSRVSQLFELRHVICHEAPSPSNDVIYRFLSEQLHAVALFIQALGEVLTFEVFGKLPLTQAEMNERALTGYEASCKDMIEILNKLRDKYHNDAKQLNLLEASQTSWEKYREAQACFRHDPVGGGSIGPMVRAFEAMEITKERTERLRVFLEAQEGWM